MNNPFPSAAALAAEAMVDRLLAEQEAASASFRSAATAFLAFLRDQHFPLGSPCGSWDLIDIEAALKDWAHDVRDEAILEQYAEDAALERFKP